MSSDTNDARTNSNDDSSESLTPQSPSSDYANDNPRDFEEKNPHLFNQESDFPSYHSPNVVPSNAIDGNHPPDTASNVNADSDDIPQQLPLQQNSNINSAPYELKNGNTYPYCGSSTFNDTASERVMAVMEVQRSNEQNDGQGQSQEARDNDNLDFLIVLPTANQTNQNVTTNENPIAQSNMKKSTSNDTINFSGIGNSFYLQQDVRLLLTVPPNKYQRRRYENELDVTPRYISVTDQRTLTLELSDDPDRFASVLGFSCYLQIFRTTVPINHNGGTVFIHPYPLWVNDKDAHVYNNTLLIPVKTQIIKLNRLVMVQAKQSSLKKIRHLKIYSPDELISTNTHEINANEKNTMIDTYQLRYSIIHFRICMVDQTRKIWLTDLHCQTDQICEVTAVELKDLPEEVRLTQK